VRPAARPWWQWGVIYEIYPRSFQDSDGDGIGDLAGILARVDHLSWLGVDAIWIAPIFPSPMADFGYDITDHKGIDPIFGTLADFDRLLAALHARGIHLILDFVPNHTSEEHPWFREARGSRTSPRRDWYIWHDPAPDGGPPNNWLSLAGGSAWTFERATGQYYLHTFLRQQPDLNWRHPAVRAAMYEVLRFWLERGVDGFRVDVLGYLLKDAQFRDDPPNPDWREGDPPFQRLRPLYSCDQPGILDIAVEMRRVLEGYPGERVLIGETCLPFPRFTAYYGPELDAVHLPFNFELIWGSWNPARWNAASLVRLIRDYMQALPPGGWPNWVLGNHDQPRIASRIGPAQARVAMMLLLTLQGTPTLYYGDELGLTNVPIPPDRVRDPFGLNMPGTGQGRDPERTPMPWDGSPHAGFTTGEPWLPLNPDHATVNVAAQRQDPASLLRLTRALLDLRRRTPALAIGDWAPLGVEENVLAYERRLGEERFVIALNLDAEPRSVVLGPNLAGRVVLSASPGRDDREVAGSVRLEGNGGLVIEVEGP
jgi:alpha-glucosidase